MSRKEKLRRSDAKRYKERRDADLCTRCGEPSGGKCYCAQCMKKDAARKRDKQERNKKCGLCTFCNRPSLPDATSCISCWAKKKCSDAGVPRSMSDKLIGKLAEQDFLCCYSDRKLVPGVNASIDHQIPTSLDGSNDLENLVWVDTQINRVKNNLSHEEFVALCRYIAEKF